MTVVAMASRRRPNLQWPAFVRVTVRAVGKATLISLPVVCLLGIGGYWPLAVVLVGVPVLFVPGMTAFEIYRAFWGPAKVISPPASPPLGPKGVLSPAEAEARFADLIMDLWERDGGNS